MGSVKYQTSVIDAGVARRLRTRDYSPELVAPIHRRHRSRLSVLVLRYRLVSLFYRFKPLDPSAPVGLSHINVAFGIDGQCVGVGKFADLMARATEA